MDNEQITDPAEVAATAETPAQQPTETAQSTSDEVDLPPLGLWEMFEPHTDQDADTPASDDASDRVLTRPRTSVWDLGRTRV